MRNLILAAFLAAAPVAAQIQHPAGVIDVLSEGCNQSTDKILNFTLLHPLTEAGGPCIAAWDGNGVGWENAVIAFASDLSPHPVQFPLTTPGCLWRVPLVSTFQQAIPTMTGQVGTTFIVDVPPIPGTAGTSIFMQAFVMPSGIMTTSQVIRITVQP